LLCAMGGTRKRKKNETSGRMRTSYRVFSTRGGATLTVFNRRPGRIDGATKLNGKEIPMKKHAKLGEIKSREQQTRWRAREIQKVGDQGVIEEGMGAFSK